MLQANRRRLLEVGVFDTEKKLRWNKEETTENSAAKNVKLTLWIEMVVGRNTSEQRLSEKSSSMQKLVAKKITSWM